MMKKAALIVLSVLMITSFAACRKSGDLGEQTKVNDSGVVEYNTVGTFDYSEFAKEHEKNSTKEGFVNTKESACRDKGTAKALAEKELADDFTYDTVKIAYDRTEGIWKVEFSQNAQGTGKLSVCIEDTGITKLIVKE